MAADGSSGDADEGAARARSIALLEAVHQFPGSYALTVIAFNDEMITTAVKSAVGGGGDAASVEHRTVESRAGKYVSHRFSVWVGDAHEVLEIYARVRSVEGVVTIL